jgi:hypothetical protein
MSVLQLVAAMRAGSVLDGVYVDGSRHVRCPSGYLIREHDLKDSRGAEGWQFTSVLSRC